MDSSAARRRRLATFEKRLGKARGRRSKLNSLNLSAVGKLRMVKGSIMPAGLYGQAQGMAPRHLTWAPVRTMVAGTLGRQKLGGVGLVLDMFAHRVLDPHLQIVGEHFQTLFRVLRSGPDLHTPEMWRNIVTRLTQAKQPWLLVAGPLAAGMQYLRDLGWDVSN